jgi:hypothetical protein
MFYFEVVNVLDEIYFLVTDILDGVVVFDWKLFWLAFK